MKNYVLAYARALQSLLNRDLDFYQFIQALKKIKPVFQKEVQQFFSSCKIDVSVKKNLLHKVFNDPSCKNLFLINREPFVLNFFSVLLDRGHFCSWEDILKELILMENKKKGFITAQVEFVTPLKPETREKIRKSLERFFNQSVRIEEKFSSYLGGGIRLSVGGWVFNDSLAFHLKCLNTSVKKKTDILLSELLASKI